MSQIIRKLQNGDKAPEVKQARLFKDGNRDIDLDVLIKGANKNIDQYLQSKNWSRKKKQAFMDAYSDIMNSLDSGAIAQRGVDRKYTDTTGRIQNSQGKGFDAYGEVAHFLDTIVDIVPDYQKEKPKEKTKYDANELINTFKNKFFGGSDPDAIIWQGRDTKDEKTGKYGTSQRASAFAQMLDDYAASLADSDYDYEGSAFKDREDLIARLQTASAQLRDGTFDNNDYAALTALGIPGKTARTLFSIDALQEAGTEGDKTPDDPELAAAEEGLAQAKKNKERQQKIDEWKKLQQQQRVSDELTRKWYTPFTSFQRQIMQLPEVAVYDKEKYNNLLKTTKYDRQGYYESLGRLFTTYDPLTHQNGRVKNIYGQSVPYSNHIVNDMDFLNSIGGLVDAGGGDYQGFKYFPQSVDEKSGTVLLYNPQTRELMREAVYRIPALYQNIINNALPGNDNPFAMKQGGVLKFQYGGVNLNLAADNYFNTLKQQQKATEDKKVEEKAKASGRSKETQKSRDKEIFNDDLSTVDKARIASVALDIGSAASSFIPVAGTALSGGAGLGSTFINLWADAKEDGLDNKDLQNFITNLGFDAVGLLPGIGAAGKAGKIAKTLGKTLPKVLGIASTLSIVQQSPELLESLKKLTTDPKNITSGDLQNIGTVLSAIAAGNSVRQRRAFKKATATGKNNIKLEDGRVVAITDQQLREVKKAKTIDEANTAIQKATGDKTAQLSSTFRGHNPFTAKFWSLKGDPITGTEYNFNVTDNTGRKFGEFGRGLRGLDERLYMWKTGQDRKAAPDWWNRWVNSVNGKFGDRFKYNIYGRQSSKPQSSQSTTTKIAGQLPTSRRIRLREKGISDEELNRRGIYKQGGIIKAENGSPLYNQSRYGDSFLTDWASLVTTPVTAATIDGKKNTYGKVGKAKGYTFDTTSRLNTVLDLLGRGKMTDNDVSMFQRRHAGMYAGYNPSLSPIYNEQVKQYQTDWNSLGLNQSIIAPGYNANYDIASKKPISGDSGVSNWKSDGRYDQITDDRRILARREDYYTNGVLDQAKLDADIAAAKAKGYEYYLDPQSNYYMLKKIESPAQEPAKTVPETVSQTQPKTKKTELAGIPQQNNTNKGTWLSAFIDQAPNFLAAGRLAGNIANNNRVTAEVKKGLKPLIENTYNLQRRVQGDLATKQAYYTRAAGLESLAARPMTSDASLQLAGQLEAKSKGNQYRTEGDLADNQAIRESAEKTWQVQADNAARRSAVANANRARILKNNAALHNLEAGRMSANWQSIDNFLKQREYDWRTKRNQQRQFDLGVIKGYLSNKYSETPQMEALRKQILAKADKKEDYSDLYSQYLKLKQDQNTQFTNDYKDAYARIYGLRFNSPTPTYRPLKDGGKIEVARIKAKTESAKLFQENIKESVRNNIKMIDNLSRVTKELILKSMSL